MISLLLNKYVLGAVLVAALLAGCAFAYWHHGNVRYTAGIAAQQAADAKSLVAYTKATEARYTQATETYSAEIDHLRLHPIALPVTRLCLDVPSSPVPGQIAGGPVSPGTPTADIQHLPAADHPIRPVPGPPIQDLLSLLAGRADDTSAQLRALIEAAK